MSTDLSPEYRLCRLLRAHALEAFSPDRRYYSPPDWGVTFHFRCTRCGTERHDTIDALGELGARRYVYAEGYRLPAGEERPTTQELRLLYVDDLRRARRARSANRARSRGRASK